MLLFTMHAPPLARGAGAAETSSELHAAPDLTAFDFKQLRVQSFQAVLINTGWETPAQQPPSTERQQQQQQQQAPKQQQPRGQQAKQQQVQDPAGPGPSSQQAAAGSGVPSWGYGSSAGGSSSSSSVVSRLEALPVPQLCPRGFIMIWANKEHLSGGGPPQLHSMLKKRTWD
jgi:hypothetical protein